MRRPLVAAALAALLGACAARGQPYRFSSPMLGAAELPPAPLRGEPPPAPPATIANRAAQPIRVVSAPPIREASAAAASAVALPAAAPALPAPHRLPATAPLPAVRAVADLRALVGRRDARDPFAAIVGLAHALGATAEGTTGGELVAWADGAQRLADPGEPAQPGDLLVFDRATSDLEADLVALVIARDARGVTEYLYLGGGVYRRGFVEPAQPAKRRDATGLVLNTFLRTGKRWPAKGTHYLAGELLAHVVHAR